MSHEDLLRRLSLPHPTLSPIFAEAVEAIKELSRAQQRANDELEKFLAAWISIEDSVTMGQERERREEWVPKARVRLLELKKPERSE